MKKEEIYKDLYNAIVELEVEKGKEAANKLIKEGYDPLLGIEEGLSKGMKVMGDKFGKMEIFLPELIMAADVFDGAMEILKPHISTKGVDKTIKGKIVIGTVSGDIHRIGKDIVAMLLETAGFKVYNLGVNVSVSKFLEEAEKTKADIIGLSSLLTTTMPIQKDLIDVLREKGEREKYFVIVGGAPTSEEWAEEIGADGYGKNAEKTVTLALELISKKVENNKKERENG